MDPLQRRSTIEQALFDVQLRTALRQWYSRSEPGIAVSSPLGGLSRAAWSDLCSRMVSCGWARVDNSEELVVTEEGRLLLYAATERHLREGYRARYDKLREVLDGLARGPAAEQGCGGGNVLELLSELGYNPLYGFDLHPLLLEVTAALLHRQGRTAHLHAGDGAAFPGVPDESLALIYSRFSLQYFDRPTLARNTGRTLRPGGHLVMELLSLRYYTDFIRRELRRRAPRNAAQAALTLLRTAVFDSTRWAPRLGARARELAWTRHGIKAFAGCAGLELQDVRPAATGEGRLVILKKK